ncbi:MAG: integrase arm-type DNA-binding domain-containing protein [Pseudomonadota bacterium]
MTTRLTDRAVESARAADKRREIPDGLLAGLYLIVQPSGAKSWAVRYRNGSRTRKATLGRYPAIRLADARRLARETLISVAEGRDPGAEKIAKRDDTFEWQHVAERFLATYCAQKVRQSTATEYARAFKLHVTPRWRGRDVRRITRRDVVALVDGLAEGGMGAGANRVLAAVRKLFSWAVERSIVDASPAAGIGAPVKELSRDRVLNDAELAAVWAAMLRLPSPNREFAQILVLTGQRRDEVAGMRWEELVGSEWRLPAGRTKNGRAHVVPLAPVAGTTIAGLPTHGDFVFTTTGRTPISGHSKIKARLDAAVGMVAPDMPPWRLHDLRRTFATKCAELGIALHVVERCLNHVSGSFGGVVGVYQRHEFADEKRAAFEAWAAHLEGLGS